MTSENTDQRVTELEMALAHLEQTLGDLSKTVHRQWAEIDSLKREITRLEATKADLPEDPGQKPPHY